MWKPFDFTPHLCYTLLGKKGDATKRASFMIRNRVLCRGIRTTDEQLIGSYEKAVGVSKLQAPLRFLIFYSQERRNWI